MTGKGGRPTIATPFGRKVTLSIRTTSGIKAALAAEAEGQGGNLSEEAERRIVASLESDKSLDQAMVLAYGPDNAGLLCLIGEVLRIVTPHGEWLDNDAGLVRPPRAAPMRVLMRSYGISATPARITPAN